MMAKRTLLLLWVMVLAVSQLQAVPIRNHGGVIYGTDFLRILDPRARPASTGEEEAKPITTTRSSRIIRTTNTPTTTTLTPSLKEDVHDSVNLMLNSRHLRKLESSSSSTISSISIASSFSSKEILNLGNSKQKSRISNNLEANRKSGTKVRILDNGSSVSQKSTQESIPSRNKPVLDKGSKLNSQNDTHSTLDYDYYYYYLDDLPLLEELSNDNHETRTVTHTSTTLPTVGRTSDRNDKLSTTPMPKVQSTTSKTHKVVSTTFKPIVTTTISTLQPTTAIRTFKLTTIRTTSNSADVSTTSKPTTLSKTSSQSSTISVTSEHPALDTSTKPTIVSSTSKQATDYSLAEGRVTKSDTTTARPLFRYQTTKRSEILPSDSKTKLPSSDGENNKNETTSNPKTDTTTTTESNNVRTNSPLLRTATTLKSDTTPPPRTTSTPKSTRESVISAPSTTLLPSVLRTDENQRAKGQKNAPLRQFRYTTPLPKDQREKGEIAVTEKVIRNENALRKSLGSASSSSVIVEVRVDSPQREARRMPEDNIDTASQTLSKTIPKGTSVPPRRAHTVNPDHHTTSFLLSDSLVVDLKSGPKTSNKNSQSSRRTEQSSSSRVHTRLSTTPKTITVNSTSQIKNNQNKTSSFLLNSNNSKVINDEPASSQTLPDTSPHELPESAPLASVNLNDTTHLKKDNTSHLQPLPLSKHTQSQSVSTSVSRTVAHTARKISRGDIVRTVQKPTTTTPMPTLFTTTIANVNLTTNQTFDKGNNTSFTNRTSALTQRGIAPQGIAPFGLSPEGLAPFGSAPEGIRPHGDQPIGEHPQGLSPHGIPHNESMNATASKSNAKLTFVDATVAEGANSSVGYVAVEHNISRFRLEEKTPDGFIIGEYGEVDHQTGDVNGVRYTAEGNADPNLIYDALLKFLNL